MPSEPAVRTGPTAATPPKAYDGHRAATPRDARADRKNVVRDVRKDAPRQDPPDPGPGSTPTLRVRDEAGTRPRAPERALAARRGARVERGEQPHAPPSGTAPGPRAGRCARLEA